MLGRRDHQSGKYIAEALSIYQTEFDEGELARVRAAHPDEPDVRLDECSGLLRGHLETDCGNDRLTLSRNVTRNSSTAGRDLATRLPHI